MGIEVIHDQSNEGDVRVAYSQQLLNLECPICRGALQLGISMAYSGKRFRKQKNAASSMPLILKILLGYRPGTDRERFARFAKHLIRLLIHADQGDVGIIREVIEFQNIFHAGYKSRVFLWRNAPVFT